MKTPYLIPLLSGVLLTGCGQGAGQRQAVQTTAASVAIKQPADNYAASGNAAGGDQAVPAKAQPTLAERMEELNLSADAIKGELESDGRVVRSRHAPYDAPEAELDSDSVVRLVTEEFKANPDLASLNLTIQPNRNVVSISGSAASFDQIAKAIALSLYTQGITQTISRITVEPPAPQP